MAVGVGDIERTVEGLVNRGIGVSGLTQRTVGQMNIEALHSLGQNIAESEATRKNLQEQRVSELNSSRLSNIRNLRPSGSGSGSSGSSMDPNKPSVLLRTNADGTIKATYRQSEGVLQTTTFDSLDHALQFINNSSMKDYQVGFEVASATSQQDLTTAKIRNVPLLSAAGTTPYMTSIYGSGTAKPPKFRISGSVSKKETEVKPSNPLEALRSGFTLTANEQARAIDAVVGRVTSSDYTDTEGRDAVMAAMGLGKDRAFSAVKTLISKGAF